jgi:putative component of membrane protein insertase Oxa1/YidC/SpoIIIJ protein YidD
MVRAVVLLMLVLQCHAEEPWEFKEKTPRTYSYSPFSFMVCCHQQLLSQADGPRSHYVPCSSTYTREAIAYWGNWYGFLLGCDRLLRENNEEWVYRKIRLPEGCVKWDPVPKKLLQAP